MLQRTAAWAACLGLITVIGLALLVGPATIASQEAVGATLVVTSRTDSGAGSLRQALNTARSGDTIAFDPIAFPPSAPMTITLLAELPEITQNRLTIDGSNAGVVLDGRYTPGWSDGLRIRSDDNTVKGLKIVRFPGDGIELTGGASGNQIGGNWQVGNAPHGEGNVITLNGDEGIDANGAGTDDNIISGNLVGLDADGAEDIRIQALAISPAFAQDRTLFIGTRYHGVLKSTDGEQHWQPTNAGLTMTNVLSLAISPAYQSDRTLFAGTTSGRIFRSSNGGASWDASDTASIWRDISALAISPAFATDGQVFAATLGQGILGSTDYGATWQLRNEGVSDWVVHDLAISPNFAVDHLLYASTGSVAFKTSNGGQTWRATSLPAMRHMYNIVMSPNYATDQTIFISVDDCNAANMLWKSTDGGDQWTATGGNPGWCHIQALAIAPDYASGPTLIVGDEWGGIYRSLDGGASWLNIYAARYTAVAAFSPTYAQDRTTFLGAKNGMLLKSTDGTSSWFLASETMVEEGNHNVGIHIREGAQRNTVGGSTVGLRNTVSRNGIDGIVVSGSGTNQNRILGNFIGTDATGNRPLGNGGSGVVVREQAQENTIGGNSSSVRNVVSGNRMSGITVSSQGTTHNTVAGNYIGLGNDGSTALGNYYSGLSIDTGASYSRVGGTLPAEANVISGNGENGVTIREASSYNTVIGNRVGTNAAGTAAAPNYYQGLVLGSGAHHNQIGGMTTAERNLISGNDSNGIGIWEAGTSFNIIIGNYLGTDAGGTAGLGNRESGVLLTNAAENNRVGGDTSAERNVIAGNEGAGVALSWSTVISNTIIGNYIGVGADGVSPLGNRWGVACWDNAQLNTIRANVIADSAYNGIHLSGCDRNTVSGNFIGTDPTGTRNLGNQENGITLQQAATGNQLGPANIIAHNRGRGISIWDAGSVNNRITENAIFANSAGGIDLGGGGNADLPAPVIAVIGSSFVSGYAPVAGARVEVFSDENGQGRTFEGATTSAIDGSFTFAKSSGLIGPKLNVTATDLDGNTTEFSASATKPPQSATDPYEPDDVCGQAQPIGAAGTAQPHTFHRQADADWAWFDTLAGMTYIVETTDTGSRAQTAAEVYASCAAPATPGGRSFGNGFTISFTAAATGRHYVKITNHDPGIFGEGASYNLSVRSFRPNALAVIVAGHDGAFTAQENITFAADRAYRIFRNAGFSKSNLRYLGPDPNRDVDGNGLLDDIAGQSSVANVRYAIRDWPRERGIGTGVPLYIFLVDHGLVDRFKTEGDLQAGQVSATDLDLWLSDLESATGADNISIFIDTCYSGSFIDETAAGPATISGRNRVVIASTSSSLQAFGPTEGQGLYFSNAFFSSLDNQQSLWAGFQLGIQAVASQELAQQPWLDDNGDRRFDATDGALAAGRALRRVAYGGLAPRIEWVRGDRGVGLISARVSDDSGWVGVRVEVFAPSYIPPAPDGSGATRIVDVPVINLTDLDGDGTYSGTFAFAEDGTYRLVAHAQDAEGNLALPLSGVVRTGDSNVRLYLPLVLR